MELRALIVLVSGCLLACSDPKGTDTICAKPLDHASLSGPALRAARHAETLVANRCGTGEDQCKWALRSKDGQIMVHVSFLRADNKGDCYQVVGDRESLTYDGAGNFAERGFEL